MSPTLLHLILALCLLILTLVVGFGSIKIVHVLDARGEKARLFLSLLNCFAGGVFLGVCFLDMMPDVSDNYEQFIKDHGSGFKFAWPQFFTCIGFFLVYVVEELCFFCLSRGDDGHGHSHSGTSSEGASTHSGDKLALEAGHGQSHGHGHSHCGDFHDHHAPPSGSLVRAFTFAAAISFHSLLEGFALGVQSSTGGTVTLFISLMLHKGVEAFSVGLQVSKGNNERMKAVIVTVIVYSLMSPIGTVIGTLVETSKHIKLVVKDGVIFLLEALANGSFVYVTFLEVLAEEKASRKYTLFKLISIFVGFGIIAIIIYFFADSGDDDEVVNCLNDLVNATTAMATTSEL